MSSTLLVYLKAGAEQSFGRGLLDDTHANLSSRKVQISLPLVAGDLS